MKKNLHISAYFGLFLLVLLASACEKEVKLDFEESAPKIAVVCNFSPDEPFILELSKSKSINSTSLGTSFIDNAEVQICVGSEIIENILPNLNSPDSGTKYQSTGAPPQTREIYTLKIEADGLEPITATSTIPEAIEITHSTIGQINVLENDGLDAIKAYEVRLGVQFEDPANETNYYQISFYQELISSDPAIQINNKVIVPNYGYASIDENLTNNFNLIDGGLLFKDLTFDGTTNEFIFEPLFEYDTITYKPENIIIELRSVSEEYYKYYTSIYRQSSQGNVPFTDPTIIYSNIKNGYGIFAGYNKVQVKSIIEF